MKNIDRLAKYITKYGTDGILVHTIPGTSNWIVCSKIEIDKWTLTMCNPMGNVTYNLGTVNKREHLQLWSELIRMEIEIKTSQILMARELKNKIQNITKN